MLEYLHTLSSEGLLDPEWMTDTSDQFYTKYLTGRNFISSYIYGSPFSETLNFNEEYDVEWGMINMPATLDGEPGYRASEHEIGQTLSTGFSIVVNAATEYPELVVKMIDYQYSDEIVDLTNWGIEGLTYTVDENGEKDYVDEIKNADSALRKAGGIWREPVHELPFRHDFHPAAERCRQQAAKAQSLLLQRGIRRDGLLGFLHDDGAKTMTT